MIGPTNRGIDTKGRGCNSRRLHLLCWKRFDHNDLRLCETRGCFPISFKESSWPAFMRTRKSEALAGADRSLSKVASQPDRPRVDVLRALIGSP